MGSNRYAERGVVDGDGCELKELCEIRPDWSNTAPLMLAGGAPGKMLVLVGGVYRRAGGDDVHDAGPEVHSVIGPVRLSP